MAGAIPMRCRWWPRTACLMHRWISSRPGSRRCAAGFHCYASDCWLDHGLERSLLPRWRSLGGVIAGLPLAGGLLMRAALVPAPGETSPSWVPMVHPVEIDPGLYSAPTAAFDALADQADDGLRVGARMGALSRERLREGLLHGQALIAFANAAQAERNPATVLAGFRPERFFKLFPH